MSVFTSTDAMRLPVVDREFFERHRFPMDTRKAVADFGSLAEFWAKSPDAFRMLEIEADLKILTPKEAHRLGCALVRRVWDYLGADGQAALVAAEQFAEGKISAAELEVVRIRFSDALRLSSLHSTYPGHYQAPRHAVLHLLSRFYNIKSAEGMVAAAFGKIAIHEHKTPIYGWDAERAVSFPAEDKARAVSADMLRQVVGVERIAAVLAADTPKASKAA